MKCSNLLTIPLKTIKKSYNNHECYFLQIKQINLIQLKHLPTQLHFLKHKDLKRYKKMNLILLTLVFVKLKFHSLQTKRTTFLHLQKVNDLWKINSNKKICQTNHLFCTQTTKLLRKVQDKRQ